MELKSFYKKHENFILAAILLAGLLLFVSARYDHYYDLNDDVLIKDLMAGAYTGEPEGHNIQVLYPLSLAVSLAYRVFPGMPVYGFFLCLCQYGCLWLMAKRSLCFCRETWKKILLAAAEGVIIGGLFLEHLVFVQYTVTSALLSAAAAFLFLTSDEVSADGKVSSRKEGTAIEFIRRNIPSVLLAVLSFQLRTEMMELLFPLLCVAGVYRWSTEEKIFTKINYKKYFAVLGAVLAGAAVSWAANIAAFGGEWRSYVDFFNSRTELYDFQGIPSYEGNEALYEDLGMTEKAKDMLLDQYNFGLDDNLDAGVLDAVVRYQDRIRRSSEDFPELLKKSLGWYRYRIFHREEADSAIPDDYPWNYMVILGYGAVFLAGLEKSKGMGRKAAAHIGKNALCLGLLAAVRTALWMFILVRGREPVRITHSLYLMEFSILMGMLLAESGGRKTEGKRKEKTVGAFWPRLSGMGYFILFSVILTLTAMLALPEGINAVDSEFRNREKANAVYEGMKEYGRNHKDCFYFQDVYSAVSYPSEPYAGTPYSEKMFVGVDNGLANYDLMGGWLVKSPSQKKKLEQFGIKSMREGLLEGNHIYVMAELEKGADSIAAYFQEQGGDVKAELVDTIENVIGVYRIKAEERQDVGADN